MYVFASLLLTLVVVPALVLGLVWVLYVPVLARSIVQSPWLVADRQPRLDEGEECRFLTADSLTLVGTYFRTSAPARLGVIVACHELMGDRWTMLPYVNALRARGFDIFTFDFRNHGDSGSSNGYAPLPWLTQHEVVDVRAALDYLSTREDADPRGVGLLGVSRGGVAALCAASRDRRVRAIVSDGAYSTAAMQIHYMRRYMAIFTLFARQYALLPDWFLGALTSEARRLVEHRRRIRFVRVELALRRLHQPVLLIHGELDPFVPLEIVDSLARQLSWRTRRWVVPQARHNGALDAARAEYERRVARFFLKHLAAGRRTPAVRPQVVEAIDAAAQH